MKRYRMAVVGLHFGKWLIDNEIIKGYAAPYFELAAVCDQNEVLAHACAREYHVKAYTRLEDALADRDIDLVTLITGPNHRAKLLDKIVDAGKAVMTTKPFETDAAEALRILKKAEAAGVPLFINSPQPVAPDDIACIQEWQEKYALGRLVGYHASNWASYREDPDGTWYDDPEQCPAAPLLRLGIYCMSDLSWFIPEDIEELTVVQSRVFTRRPTSDNAHATVKHADGTLGSIYSSFCVGDGEVYQNRLELQFEGGSVTRKINSMLLLEDDFIELELSTQYHGKHLTEKRTLPKYGSGYRWDWMHHVLTGESLPEKHTRPEQIAKSIRLIEKVKEAAREQRK